MRAHETGPPILVVEDEPGTRAQMTRILRHAGYPVVAVGNGEEALEYLRQDSRPCLVVLDLMLPVMDGFEFRVRQMQDPEIANIPVVVVSGGGGRRAEGRDAAPGGLPQEARGPGRAPGRRRPARSRPASRARPATITRSRLDQRGASRPSPPAGQSPSGSTPRSLTLGRAARAEQSSLESAS